MRTARTVIVLDTQRPTSSRVLAEADQSFQALTTEQRIGDIRFTGYTTPSDLGIANQVGPDARCAIYEADYPDTTA